MDVEDIVKNDVTFIVSTCYRPQALQDMLQSLRTYYPTTPVIVCDDSDQPYPGMAMGMGDVRYFSYENSLPRPDPNAEFPWHGAPYCYNFMLKHVKTKYFVLLDDDFIFTDRTDIRKWIPWIQSGEFDIVGGSLNNVDGRRLDFVGNLKFIHKDNYSAIKLNKDRNLEECGSPYKRDVILNFFMASTVDVIRMGWDPDQKIYRHLDFYLHAMQHHLSVGYLPEVNVTHAPYSNEQYFGRRKKYLPHFYQRACQKWGVDEIIEDDTCTPHRTPHAPQEITVKHEKSVAVEFYPEDDILIPKQATPESAGSDLVSHEYMEIPPLKRRMVKCGIQAKIPSGYVGMVCPRSGLAAKHGITVLNAPGIIDSDYLGEICVILYNTDYDTFRVNKGDRIAQLVIVPYVAASWSKRFKPFDEKETERGAGGFGSTGI